MTMLASLLLLEVLITLLDSSSNVVATILTNSSGEREFVDLLVGSYTVTKTNSSGFGDGFEVDGTNDNIIMITLTTLNVNSIANNFIDKALPLASSVSPAPSKATGLILKDSAREDVDNDGKGNTPLPGVLILLTDSTGTVVLTKLTDSNGNYALLQDIHYCPEQFVWLRDK